MYRGLQYVVSWAGPGRAPVSQWRRSNPAASACSRSTPAMVHTRYSASAPRKDAR